MPPSLPRGRTSASRHLMRGRPATGRFPLVRHRCLATGGAGQHAHSHRADLCQHHRHGIARLWPHRQCRLQRSQGVHRHPGPVQQRALGADGFCRRSGVQPRICRTRRHAKQPAAGQVRYRPPGRHPGQRSPENWPVCGQNPPGSAKPGPCQRTNRMAKLPASLSAPNPQVQHCQGTERP